MTNAAGIAAANQYFPLAWTAEPFLAYMRFAAREALRYEIDEN